MRGEGTGAAGQHPEDLRSSSPRCLRPLGGSNAAGDGQQAAGSRQQGTTATPDPRHPTPDNRDPAPATRPPAPYPRYLLSLQSTALVLAGLLCSVGFLLAPILPRTMLPSMSSREVAFLWAGPAGVMLGLGYAGLARSLLGRSPSSRTNLALAAFIVAFLGTILAMIAAPAETMQFYLLLFFLFPCSILVYGIAAGRLWAVIFGIVLNLLIGLASPAGPQRSLGELLGYAALFVAAAELSFSSASYKSFLDRELADAPGEVGRRNAREALEAAVRGYWPRLVAMLFASSLALFTALAVFDNPGSFGPAFAESFEAGEITALLLPAVLIIAALVPGLLLPDDAGARARNAAARFRRSLCRFRLRAGTTKKAVERGAA